MFLVFFCVKPLNSASLDSTDMIVRFFEGKHSFELSRGCRFVPRKTCSETIRHRWWNQGDLNIGEWHQGLAAWFRAKSTTPHTFSRPKMSTTHWTLEIASIFFGSEFWEWHLREILMHTKLGDLGLKWFFSLTTRQYWRNHCFENVSPIENAWFQLSCSPCSERYLFGKRHSSKNY